MKPLLETNLFDITFWIFSCLLLSKRIETFLIVCRHSLRLRNTPYAGLIPGNRQIELLGSIQSALTSSCVSWPTILRIPSPLHSNLMRVNIGIFGCCNLEESSPIVYETHFRIECIVDDILTDLNEIVFPRFPLKHAQSIRMTIVCLPTLREESLYSYQAIVYLVDYWKDDTYQRLRNRLVRRLTIPRNSQVCFGSGNR